MGDEEQKQKPCLAFKAEKGGWMDTNNVEGLSSTELHTKEMSASGNGHFFFLFFFGIIWIGEGSP